VIPFEAIAEIGSKASILSPANTEIRTYASNQVETLASRGALSVQSAEQARHALSLPPGPALR